MKVFPQNYPIFSIYIYSVFTAPITYSIDIKWLLIKAMLWHIYCCIIVVRSSNTKYDGIEYRGN